MSTEGHFFKLAELIPQVVPFFWAIFGILLLSVLGAFIRQLLLRRPFRWRGLLPVAMLAFGPVLLIWIGARMIHLDSTVDASTWPETLIAGLLVLLVARGFREIAKRQNGRVLFTALVSCELWIIVSAAFVADLAVCGDYHRFIL